MNLSGYFNCNAVSGAQSYEWYFSNASGYSRTVTTTIASLVKTSVSGLQNGVTYSVAVRAKVGGVLGSFGPVCSITINTSLPTAPFNGDTRAFEEEGIASAADSDLNDYKLNAFPNPSGDNGFEISIDGLNNETENNVMITLYDIYGKVVLSELFSGQSNGTLTKINSDGTLSKGIYLVKADVNGKIVNQRVIIQ
jgi:hypothetical protein